MPEQCQVHPDKTITIQVATVQWVIGVSIAIVSGMVTGLFTLNSTFYTKEQGQKLEKRVSAIELATKEDLRDMDSKLNEKLTQLDNKVTRVMQILIEEKRK